MQHPSPEAFAHAHPASLWTGEVKVLFLDCLSQRGNVRLACRAVGLSAETAYRQRRRDPLFARAWAAAMVLARRVGEQVLADRAIDGVEEEVWFRGELVGTRRRYDSRLLLAHLARLDRAADEMAEQDAERFDELLALAAGEDMPGDYAAPGEDPLPDRDDFVEQAIDDAREAMLDRLGFQLDLDGEIEDEEEEIAFDCEWGEEHGRVLHAADGQWHGWLHRAHTRVDAILGCGVSALALSTVSTVSTPAAGPAS